MNILVTIFTPTYNRKHLLPKLYESLGMQSIKNFEWLVIDDGSTDDTENYIKDIQNGLADFPIRYYKQKNQGKAQALNKAVKLAQGILFMVIDSDDWADTELSIFVQEMYDRIKDTEIKGFGFLRSTETHLKENLNNPDINKEVITHNFENQLKVNFTMKGEYQQVFYTELLKKYPYPKIKNEKFIRESYVFKQIKSKYSFLLTNKVLMYGNYLEEGLTKNFGKLIKNNPLGNMYFFSLLLNMPYPAQKKKEFKKNYWNSFRWRMLLNKHFYITLLQYVKNELK